MTEYDDQFEQIIEQLQDPAIEQAKLAIQSIEQKMNDAVRVSLSDSREEVKGRRLATEADRELGRLREDWPYTNQLLQATGDIFLTARDGDGPKICRYRGELVVFEGFEVVNVGYNPNDPDAPHIKIAYKLGLMLEDEIAPAIALPKDITLIPEDDPLTSK